jgi:hypothetical protein
MLIQLRFMSRPYTLCRTIRTRPGSLINYHLTLIICQLEKRGDVGWSANPHFSEVLRDD